MAKESKASSRPIRSSPTRPAINRRSPHSGSKRRCYTWRIASVEQQSGASTSPAVAARPFERKQIDVASRVRRRAAIWSKILPFVLMIWALTGAFYPAVDLCAGEKERGTLETLLSSPAARSEIVWGKLLTVMTFSMATVTAQFGQHDGHRDVYRQRRFSGWALSDCPSKSAPPPDAPCSGCCWLWCRVRPL